MNLQQLGAKNKLELKGNPIIYISANLISSLSFSGPMTLIDKSIVFTDDVKTMIKGIKGLISLGNTNGFLKNAHIYSANAKTLDGRERICYIQQEGNDLIVTDYKGNRGAKHSALFKLFSEEMIKCGFLTEKKNIFKIPKDKIYLFVKVINIIIENREKNMYELRVLDDIESIVIQDERYFYNKTEWVHKTTNKDDFYNLAKSLTDKVKITEDVDLLIQFDGELIKLSEMIKKKIAYLKCV